jgi:hypothetical protein
LPLFSSAAEPHHLDAALALRKDLQAAPAPTLRFGRLTFFKAKKYHSIWDFFLWFSIIEIVVKKV